MTEFCRKYHISNMEAERGLNTSVSLKNVPKFQVIHGTDVGNQGHDGQKIKSSIQARPLLPFRVTPMSVSHHKRKG